MYDIKVTELQFKVLQSIAPMWNDFIAECGRRNINSDEEMARLAKEAVGDALTSLYKKLNGPPV